MPEDHLDLRDHQDGTAPFGVAFVGCGYVADLYAATLPNHPSLRLTGVHDRDPARSAAFTAHHRVPGYRSLDALLADPAVDAVVNLTNPESHYEVTRAALLAGKHVYVEKPLATDLERARELVELATGRGLRLASAPCGLLGTAAQTAWRALREGRIGTPRLVYAELDDGPILRMPFHEWISPSGAPWPYLDEFETGCTVEHAGYWLTWLTAFFGPVRELTAFATLLAPNPHVPPGTPLAPDFSLAVLSFESGVTARLTTSIHAPKDYSLRVIGDDGLLTVADSWQYDSPVTVRRHPDGVPETVPPAEGPARPFRYPGTHDMDFARGVAELAVAASGSRPTGLPPDHALHVLELTLAISGAGPGAVIRPTTTFAPVPPMPWAR
ncbi:Gfo/Idh/MocA family oxidoreductase [Streptomyces sp. BE20]|uniref:Gfo/Idh/MocA family protein n=1 Tax=unclassified Streptomyces TaxID=2593676 RepID=UPI002E789838|nr:MULTISPECIES: Gfo/Idh/MocA family oxidoreductase [unclassified Streptomyces]MED7947743.1 Gfo/Idh/MocA family oxidoreductase [Streptomyces sp. BE303]MEE1822595.1 Gfo/Idh/MocA family oxidoreductase [Streptomyces sp. BE20]